MMASSGEDEPNAPNEEQSTSLKARRDRLRGSLAKQAMPDDPYAQLLGGSDPLTNPPANPLTNPVTDPLADPLNDPLASSAPEIENADKSRAFPERKPGPSERKGSGKPPIAPPVVADEDIESQAFYWEPAVKSPPIATAPTPPAASPLSKQEPPISHTQGWAPLAKEPEISSQSSSVPQSVALQNSIALSSGKVLEKQAQSDALEMLSSIDQALSVCAMNLANLQRSSTDHTDVIKSMVDSMQHNTLSELGLSLNSMMDTMSAALEPMKAIGDLVPAIDQLVAALGSKPAETTDHAISKDQLVANLAEQLSSGSIDPWTFKTAYTAIYPTEHPADLLHRLVDLLGTQRLSGDLFRQAYDAVQAADPPKPGAGGDTASSEVLAALEVQLEEKDRENSDLRKNLDDIKKRLDSREKEFQSIISVKEKEIGESQSLLNSRFEEFNRRYEEQSKTLQKREEQLKEKELEERKRLDESRKKDEELRKKDEEYRKKDEEFRKKDEELRKIVEDSRSNANVAKSSAEDVQRRDDELKRKDDEIRKRDDDLRKKDDEMRRREDELRKVVDESKKREEELRKKETEITQLKFQMDELREQTKDMVTGLQKQLTQPKPQEEAPRPQIQQQRNTGQQAPPGQTPQQGFFDASQTAPPGQTQQLFNGAPGTGLFQPLSESLTGAPAPLPEPGVYSAPQAVTQQVAMPPSPPAPQPVAPPAPEPQQAIPRQSITQQSQTTTMMSSPGRYSTGVRAQVFEVIVRQALVGAPWREICAGAMTVNDISPDDVEAEVKRRQALLKK